MRQRQQKTNMVAKELHFILADDKGNLNNLNPLAPMVPLSLVMKENASVVESVRNLDAKCEVQGSACTFCNRFKKNQTILNSIVFIMAQHMVPLE